MSFHCSLVSTQQWCPHAVSWVNLQGILPYHPASVLMLLTASPCPFVVGSPPSSGYSVGCSARFATIAWSEMATKQMDYPYGLVAGGMGDGTVNVWDPAKLVASHPQPKVSDEDITKYDYLFARCCLRWHCTMLPHMSTWSITHSHLAPFRAIWTSRGKCAVFALSMRISATSVDVQKSESSVRVLQALWATHDDAAELVHCFRRGSI